MNHVETLAYHRLVDQTANVVQLLIEQLVRASQECLAPHPIAAPNVQSIKIVLPTEPVSIKGVKIHVLVHAALTHNVRSKVISLYVNVSTDTKATPIQAAISKMVSQKLQLTKSSFSFP